jgi:hypothetical protein
MGCVRSVGRVARGGGSAMEEVCVGGEGGEDACVGVCVCVRLTLCQPQAA